MPRLLACFSLAKFPPSLPKLSQAPEVAEHLPAGYELEHHVQVGVVLIAKEKKKEMEMDE